MSVLANRPHQATVGVGTTASEFEALAAGRLVPSPPGLSVVVRVDVEAGRTAVIASGALTVANCGRLLTVCARAGRLAKGLAVTVDLSGTASISTEALERLRSYASLTVVGHRDALTSGALA